MAAVVPAPISLGLRLKLRGLRAWWAGFSDAVEAKILNYLFKGTAYASPAPVFMALVTVAVTDTDTAGTITEATYTGYVRKQIPTADLATATVGSMATTAQELFAGCTAGSSTVIGFALTSSASGAGDVVMYGTVSSVTITPTQTPPTLASGALTLTLD